MSMPLARRLALRHYHGREPLEDLVQVACVGLVKAVDRFDPSRRVSFWSFAVPTILGELRHHLRDTTWALHMPRGVHDASLAVERARQRLCQTTGRTPTIEQLAAETGLSAELVAEAVRVRGVNNTLPLTTPDDASVPLAERLGGEDRGFAVAEHRVMLGDAIPSLTEHEQHVLALRFVYDLTQSEIARCFGVSQMQISRVLRRALDTLSQSMRPEATGAAQRLAPCNPDETMRGAAWHATHVEEAGEPLVRSRRGCVHSLSRCFDLRASGTEGGELTPAPVYQRDRVRSDVRPPLLGERLG